MAKYMLVMRPTDESFANFMQHDFAEILESVGTFNDERIRAGVLLSAEGLDDPKESVVVDGIWFEQGVRTRRLGVEIACEHSRSCVERGPPAEGVDRAPAAHGEQPSGRLGGHTVDRPGHERFRQRLLRDVLGQ